MGQIPCCGQGKYARLDVLSGRNVSCRGNGVTEVIKISMTRRSICDGSRGPNRNSRSAFTLAELLVVVTVIALLLGIVTAACWVAIPRARSILCKNNLRQLAQLFHADGRAIGDNAALGVKTQGTVMTSSRWLDHIYRQHDESISKLLLCPDSNDSDPMMTLDFLWIRQVGNSGSVNPGEFHSNIGALIRGEPIPDWQVGALYRGQVYGHLNYVDQAWFESQNGGPIQDNEICIAIDSCAAVKIAIDQDTRTYRVTSWMGSNVGNSGSNHWVLFGDGDMDTWADDVVVRLTGQGCWTVYEPRDVGFLENSYGMNNLVSGRVYQYNQLWMTEYSTQIISAKALDRDDPWDGEDENGEFKGRHRGKMNYLTVGGAVMDMTPEEMSVEFDSIDENPDSLFNP
jgi:prepilin-type N-terminal cleavage/methylation domain-containing protein